MRQNSGVTCSQWRHYINKIQWIKGYEKKYAITQCGRVYSYRNKIWMKTPKTGRGYPTVELAGQPRKTCSVHRLVAETFIPNPSNHPMINHKDEDKTNNHYTNLEWCTGDYNMDYSCAKVHHFTKNGKHIVVRNLNKFCKEHNLNQGNMNQVSLGKKPSSKGYTLWITAH